MTLTGWQIREGRRLANLHPCQLATAAGVSTATILMAEMRDDEPSFAPDRDAAIHAALEAAGVEFVEESGNRQSVRLRNSEA